MIIVTTHLLFPGRKINMAELTRFQKTRLANIKRYGSIENYREHMREIASQGGKKTTGETGFSLLTPERLKEVASSGGKAPRKKNK